MIIVQLFGLALIVFGIIDVAGSFAGLDVWADWLHVQLPEIIWNFTAMIEITIGWLILKVGSGGSLRDE